MSGTTRDKKREIFLVFLLTVFWVRPILVMALAG